MERSLCGPRGRPDTDPCAGCCRRRSHPDCVSRSWGRPALPSRATVGSSSTWRPRASALVIARIISLAALALDARGNVEHSVVSLLNPGVDRAPPMHGLTAEMLEDQPTFAEIADEVIELLHGRTLVAHNVAFDYAFLTTEAELAGTALPIDTVMCTVELARRLKLGWTTCGWETLARHWDISQTRAHDAFDDALVLSRVLSPALQRAREHDIWLPVRPVTRRRWPPTGGSPRRVAAAENAGLPDAVPVPGTPVAIRAQLVQGMRVALVQRGAAHPRKLVSGFCTPGWPHRAVDPQTSLVVCNEPTPSRKGLPGRELSVPVVSDEQFMDNVGSVALGTGIDDFVQSVDQGQQFALFWTPTMSNDLSADDVRGRLRQTGVGRRGYDPEIGAGAAAAGARRLDGRGYLRADDVRARQTAPSSVFSRGYDRAEVDAFVDRLVAADPRARAPAGGLGVAQQVELRLADRAGQQLLGVLDLLYPATDPRSPDVVVGLLLGLQRRRALCRSVMPRPRAIR